LAVALLVRVLRRFQAADIEALIVEKDSVGANWFGGAGYTDGGFPLDTSPFKDLGFPYSSGYGPLVDRRLGRYSFIEYLKDTGRFADWVNRGDLKISHRRFGRYLGWAAKLVAPRIRRALLSRITPVGDRVELTIDACGRSETQLADGLVLTGPGEAKRVSVQDDDPNAIFDGRTYWLNRERFRGLGKGRVAVLGGGQSAGTIAMSLVVENPGLRVDILNRHGFLCAQSAGYHENALCTNPGKGWRELPLEERKEILGRIDRGVVDLSIKTFLDRHPGVRVVRGSVCRIGAAGGKVRLRLVGAEKQPPLEYDRVVVAIGFDPVEQLKRLLPPGLLHPDWFAALAAGPVVDHHFRLPGLGCNIHVPALSGISEGPGFPLLSCLGTVAARIVSAYAPPQNPPQKPLQVPAQPGHEKWRGAEVAPECFNPSRPGGLRQGLPWDGEGRRSRS
jgi:mycobactin lysine-N-oxygenase